MISKVLLLLLPSLAFASIQVSINGDYNENNPHIDVYYNGNDINVITNTDMKTFNLNEDILKSAVVKYFGQRPTDVYVRSPTPHGDLYTIYGWNQVQRIIRPISAKVISISSEPSIVLKQMFENNSTQAASFNVGITEQVKNSVSSHWSKNENVMFDAKADYYVDLGMTKGGAAVEFKYNAQWGEDYERSTTVTVGATSALQITLEPGQAVQAMLMATKTKVKVQVEYEATLTGQLAVNYDETFKGHHFWSMGVNAVANAAGIRTAVIASEEMELVYFWNSKIYVVDGPAFNRVLLQVNY